MLSIFLRYEVHGVQLTYCTKVSVQWSCLDTPECVTAVAVRYTVHITLILTDATSGYYRLIRPV